MIFLGDLRLYSQSSADYFDVSVMHVTQFVVDYRSRK